jgi:hypothetical protein
MMQDFSSEQHAIDVCSRSVMIKEVVDVFGSAKSLDELLQTMPEDRISEALAGDRTWMFSVEGLG